MKVSTICSMSDMLLYDQIMEEEHQSRTKQTTQGEQDMKREADDADADAKLTRSMSNAKVSDVFSELNSVLKSLSISNEQLTIKELAIQSLKDQLTKARDIKAMFSEKEAYITKLEAELAKCNQTIQKLESDLAKTKHSPESSSSKEITSLKTQLKQATEAEETNKKAMDDLALALKEVADESNQTKEKLKAAQQDILLYKKESEELKEGLKALEKRHKTLYEEAKKEADLQRNIVNRLRLEAEESLEAWNGKETGLVDCIKQAEDEKIAAVEENRKLLEAIETAENTNKSAKQENQKLRDILKQALNEANVAKEAAGIAQSENSQLKDVLAEKDDALIFITRENENLRINEDAMTEQIKVLKRLVSETPGLQKTEDGKLVKAQSSLEKEPKQRKLSNAFSLNLRDLIAYPRYFYAQEQDHKVEEKAKEKEDEEDGDLFKGSIFDVTMDSPMAGDRKHQNHHARRGSFAEEGEVALEEAEGVHKKKALLRRFGDILIRRKGGGHRRELSNGGELLKKETSGGDRKEPASAPAAAASEAFAA